MTVQDQVSKAETLWVLRQSVKTFHPEPRMVHLSYFKECFPDSHIAQHMTMSRTKVACMTGYGLGPYFLQKTIDDILRSPNTYYTIHFDETTTAQVKSRWMFLWDTFQILKEKLRRDFWKHWYLGMLLLRQLQMNSSGIRIATQEPAIHIIWWAKCQ